MNPLAGRCSRNFIYTLKEQDVLPGTEVIFWRWRAAGDGHVRFLARPEELAAAGVQIYAVGPASITTA